MEWGWDKLKCGKKSITGYEKSGVTQRVGYKEQRYFLLYGKQGTSLNQ